MVAAHHDGGTVTDADQVVRAPEAGQRLAPDARVRLIGRSPSPAVAGDVGPGCGQRAVDAGRFNPACAEYQGYLDPGRAGGRPANSGDLQHDWGCQQGYIPESEC